jgi:hypothetical protein
MRRKIAKALRRELIHSGAVFEHEHFIRERGWERKDCGYGFVMKYADTIYYICGDDELKAYHLAKESMLERKESKIDCNQSFWSARSWEKYGCGPYIL